MLRWTVANEYCAEISSMMDFWGNQSRANHIAVLISVKIGDTLGASSLVVDNDFVTFKNAVEDRSPDDCDWVVKDQGAPGVNVLIYNASQIIC